MPYHRTRVAQRHARSMKPKRFDLGSPPASDPRLTWPANAAPWLLLLPSRDGTMDVVAAAITESPYCVILEADSYPAVPSTPRQPSSN